MEQLTDEILTERNFRFLTKLLNRVNTQVILSTSNVSFWAVLYGGNTEGVFQ
jgi:hypothetical protein